MPDPCLDELDLRNYALGVCDAPTSERIEEHLARCPACEETLAGFDDTGDTLVRHLPLIAGVAAESAAATDDRAGWLDRLRAGPPGSGEGQGPTSTQRSDAIGADASSAYELLGILGQGGMGVVYRARHKQLGRVVALKVLHPRLTAAVEARQRFDREIRILGSLHHPGVVMATDAGRIGAASYLVMELIDGIDLARLVRRSGPLSIAEACAVAREMAEAIAAAHRAGVVHRDIKPSNVMIDRAGRVKLLDFGLAHLATLTADDPETSLGQLLGTLEYMAPEQAGPERLIGPAVDLYGLGATLFFLLTGRSPRGTGDRRSLLEQLRSLSDDVPDDVRSLRGDVPTELADLIAALLSHEPARRPSSAEEVSRILVAWSGGNLAERIAGAASPDAAEHAEDRGEAERSLSRLLAVFPGVVPPAVTADGGNSKAPGNPGTSSKGPSPGRRAAVLALGTAVTAAVCFGVTFLLQTPDGSLRIDSEATDVRIEVVDEKDQPRELTIDRSGKETSLRAGKYRIRFAGDHDGLTITPETITLRQGKQEVAKITRVPNAKKLKEEYAQALKAQMGGNVAAAAANATERLYQGQPESVWQRGFDVERDAVAKIADARALISFAAELPAERQLDRIVEIGGALLQSGWGDESFLFPLHWLGGEGLRSLPRVKGDGPISLAEARQSGQFGAAAAEWSESPQLMRPRTETTFADFAWPLKPRWPMTGELRDGFKNLMGLVRLQVKALQAATVADRLSAAILSKKAVEASFAAALLADRDLRREPEAVRLLHSRLRQPVAGLDQTALAVLIRASLYEQADAEEKRQIVAAMNAVGTQILRVPPDDLDWRIESAWLTWVRVEELPIDSRIGAEVVSRYLRLSSDMVPSLFGPDQVEISDAAVVAARRKQLSWFLPSWIDIVNRHLTTETGRDGKTQAILRSLGVALQLRLPEDAWDVKTTAELLTKRLETWYVAEPPTLSPWSRGGSGYEIADSNSPHELLLDILRMTGTIPEFGHRAPPGVAQDLARWKETRLDARSGARTNPNRTAELTARLIELAPYDALRLDTDGTRGLTFGSLSAARTLGYGGGSGRRAFDTLVVLSFLADENADISSQGAQLARAWLLRSPKTLRLSARGGSERRSAGSPRGDASPATEEEESRPLLSRLLAGPTASSAIATVFVRKIRDSAKESTLREAADTVLRELPQ